VNRRSFVAQSAAGIAASRLPAAFAATSATDRLREMLVINTLGGLDDPNVPAASNPGDERPSVNRRGIDDARASGVTAINITIGYVFGDGDPYEQSVRAISDWDALVREHGADLVKVLSTEDIRRAKTDRKIGLIYGFQNATMVGDDATRADHFADLGVRVIQLTYNPRNQLGGGALAEGNPGLTPFGRQVIDRLNAKRVIIDLSHSGQRTCADAAAASKQPIAITHTGCRALNDHPRNTGDAELRLVGSQGGYVGIYFMPFLTTGRNATADDVIAHIEHAIDVCGEDHVGLGTDGSFTQIDDLQAYGAVLAKAVAERRAAGIAAPGEQADIFPFAIDLRGPDQFRQLADKLASRGHKSSRVEKVLGLNFVRFANEVWGA